MPKSSNTNYHDLTAELQTLMADLQQGDLDIDQAVKSYQRGLDIVSQLEARLTAAENKITELRASHAAAES